MGSRHHRAILKRATLYGRGEAQVAGKNCIVQKNHDQFDHSPCGEAGNAGRKWEKTSPTGVPSGSFTANEQAVSVPLMERPE